MALQECFTCGHQQDDVTMINKYDKYFCTKECFAAFYTSVNVRGANIEFQKSDTHLQWKYVNEETWADLIPLTELKGLDGTDGAIGDQGIQGVKGYTGEQGIQGVQGYQGPKGDTGDQGLQGVKGDTGDQGIQGTKGDTGNQGVQGVKGDTGDTGYTPVKNVDYFDGLKGDAGSQGQQGIQGDTGSQGIQGVKGDTGEQGIQGIKGDTGDQGVQGIKGDTGNQGIQGIQGVKGDTGNNGYTPIKGVDYFDGAKGDKGDNGDQGIQGNQGIQGIQGIQGVPGADSFMSRLVVSGDKATGANTTPVTLGINFAYEANSKYAIDIYAMVAPTAATTGCGFMIDVSTAVTYVGTFVAHQLAATGTLSGAASIGDMAATSSGVSSGMVGTGSNFVYGGGLLITGANTGTATFYFRSETTAVTTCKDGSIVRVCKI